MSMYHYGILILDTKTHSFGDDGNSTWPTSEGALIEARHYYQNEHKFSCKLIKVWRIDTATHEQSDFLTRDQLVSMFDAMEQCESDERHIEVLPSDRSARAFYTGGTL